MLCLRPNSGRFSRMGTRPINPLLHTMRRTLCSMPLLPAGAQRHTAGMGARPQTISTQVTNHFCRRRGAETQDSSTQWSHSDNWEAQRRLAAANKHMPPGIQMSHSSQGMLPQEHHADTIKMGKSMQWYTRKPYTDSECAMLAKWAARNKLPAMPGTEFESVAPQLEELPKPKKETRPAGGQPCQ